MIFFLLSPVPAVREGGDPRHRVRDRQPPADLRVVLDLTRDVAHGVARPAAPFTAYLVGVAVGRGLTLPDALARVSALANGWDGTEDGTGD